MHFTVMDLDDSYNSPWPVLLGIMLQLLLNYGRMTETNTVSSAGTLCRLGDVCLLLSVSLHLLHCL